MITWTEIRKEDRLPTGEVLATDGAEHLVGYLHQSTDEGVICQDDNTELTKCTHYSLINIPKTQ